MAQSITLLAPAIVSRQGIDPVAQTLANVPIVPLPAAWRCDLIDNSLTWSAGVFDLFGLARGSAIERDATVAMYTDHSRYMLGRLRSAAIATRGSFTFEARIVRPTGERRWMRVTADTWVSNGRVTHLYGMKQDITDEIPL